MHRKVRGLSWAEWREKGPFIRPTARNQRRSIKAGLTYERQVGRLIQRKIKSGNKLEGRLLLGQWILYADSSGVHWAQPDIVLVCRDFVLLLECKLTQCDNGDAQMLETYKPLLEKLYSLPVKCVQVCRNLLERKSHIVSGLEEASDWPDVELFLWHCRPNGVEW